MDRPTCETCAYFQAYVDGGEGECRRHAPRSLNEVDNRDDHAVIHLPHWCGEHPDFPAYLASLKQPAGFPDPDTIDSETA